MKPAETPFNVHWIFSQSRTMSLRRSDLMAIVMGILRNQENILLLVSEKEMHQERFGRCSRSFLKRSRISWISTRNWSNWRGVCIQIDKDAQKDSTYRMTEDEYFRYKRIGGSLSINLEKSDRWEIVQPATKRWQNYTVFTKNLEKSDSHRFLIGNTKWGIRRRLHPAHLGGSRTILGGAHDN